MIDFRILLVPEDVAAFGVEKHDALRQDFQGFAEACVGGARCIDGVSRRLECCFQFRNLRRRIRAMTRGDIAAQHFESRAQGSPPVTLQPLVDFPANSLKYPCTHPHLLRALSGRAS